MEVLLCKIPGDRLGTVMQADYSQYHGKMSHKAREEAVEKFRDDPELKIMIASLKCGGIGLVSDFQFIRHLLFNSLTLLLLDRI